MPQRSHLVIAIVLLAGAVACAAEKRPVALVRAKVTSVTPNKGGGSTAVVEVVHVYSGPAEWKGRTFIDVYQQQSTTGGEARISFVVDEEGLWVLTTGEKDELWVKADTRFVFGARSRKRDNGRHAEHLKMAEAVEKVEKEKPEGRVALLRGFAADPAGEVAYWAVTAVGRLDTADAKAYLDELAAKPDPKLPLPAQIALDEVLCKRADGDWPGSKPRAVMLRGWVTTAQTEEAAGRVQGRIDLAHQRRQLGDTLAVELLAAAANADWPKTARRDVLGRLGLTADRAASDEARTAAWECVFGHMQKNDDLDLRRDAAAIVGAFPLYPARLKAVEEHLATEKDEKAAASLRAAVKKAKEMK